jgi:hypothetical protein
MSSYILRDNLVNVYYSKKFMNVFEYYLDNFENYTHCNIIKFNPNETVLCDFVTDNGIKEMNDYMKKTVNNEKDFIKSTRIIHNHIRKVNEWYEKRNSYKKKSDKHEFEKNNEFPELISDAK